MIICKVVGVDQLPIEIKPGHELVVQVTDVDPLDDGDVEVTCRVVNWYG